MDRTTGGKVRFGEILLKMNVRTCRKQAFWNKKKKGKATPERRGMKTSAMGHQTEDEGKKNVSKNATKTHSTDTEGKEAKLMTKWGLGGSQKDAQE